MVDKAENSVAKESVSRRDFIHIATGSMLAVGAGAVAWPLVAHMNPAADRTSSNGPQIDLLLIEEGQQVKILWGRKPVFIRHRTPEDINAAQMVDISELPDPETDEDRLVAGVDGSKDPKYLVIVGTCTHFGCVTVGEQGDYNGWYCPCHGAHYDTSGRIRKGPGPTNMTVPPHKYVSEHILELAPHPLARHEDRKRGQY